MILREEGAAFAAIGASFGRGLPRKLVGLAGRRRMLLDFVGRQATPVDFVLTGSRAATLAARKLDIPSFVIIDYEYVDLLVYELSGAHILHPAVIDTATMRRRGVPVARLMPFDGLKEDISFADLDLAAVPEHTFGDASSSSVHILFRPPAEESHYFRRASRDLALELLHHLADSGARVVFSPRDDRQIAYLDEVPRWRAEPIVLREPVPFVSLLKSVDAVVSAGGTMLREAAYLGVPAYSIFRGKLGAVDRHLVSIDRLSLVRSAADFTRIALTQKPPTAPLHDRPTGATTVTSMILERVQARSPAR
jgi:predicted glycosyltransferase